MPQPIQPTLKDRLLTGLLHLLPHHLLSGVMYRLARCRWQPLKNGLIRFVTARYGIDLNEAANPDPAAYPRFNDFFTRSLREGIRPVDQASEALVSPVDGRISQAGTISGDAVVQAKGHYYSLLTLLAGDEELAQPFKNGLFTTIYLSPRDYHRIHMPLDGRLRKMVFVPGKLFSVSEATTQLVPELFARNERVICLFDTAVGPMAVILVGAIFVGSMETAWHGEVRGPVERPTYWQYEEEKALDLAKGEELGRFNMGSTVILLLPPGVNEWMPELQPGDAVRLGQRIGNVNPLVD